MSQAFDDFLSEYDGLTADVANAQSSTFETNLERWLEFLDESPLAARLVNEFRGKVNFAEWYDKALEGEGSFVGSAELWWPKGKESRLGAQLCLFQKFSREKQSYIQFHASFIGSSTRFDDMVSEINSQIFSPMARDFRRYLVRSAVSLAEQDSLVAPASDRSVTLSHNSEGYADAIEQLDRLEELIRGANDFPDPEDKNQRLAEVSASRRLLESVRIRIDVLISLVYRALKYLSKKFVDVAIGMAAVAVLGLIGKLTGLW